MQQNNSSGTPHLNYRDAGVDIDAGNRLVERIKPIVRGTFRPGVMTGLGGFGALFELPLDRFREPVLVSGTDGVGTQLKLAVSTIFWSPVPSLCFFSTTTPPDDWIWMSPPT